MPDIPESVVTSLHEHEDHRFDTDEDQAGDHARLDAAFRAPRPPVRDGDSSEDEKWDGLQQGVESGEATIDDERRQDASEPSRHGDGSDTQAESTGQGPGHGPPRLCPW